MAGESAREIAKRSREKAERLLRHAEMYERGALGEELTAAALTDLPPEWTVLHDVRWPGRRFANIDHIVIGPAGIFIVDSKNWSGRVLVADSTLRQNGRSRETTVATCADSALAVSELVPSLAGVVVPVLCFVRDEPVSGWARDVMVCSTSNLLQMLLTRPERLLPDQVRTAAWQVDAQLREAARRAPARNRPRRTATPAWTASSRRQRLSRPRSRQARSTPLPRLLLSLALLLAFVLVGPQLATAFSKVLTNVIVSNVGNSSCPNPSDTSSGVVTQEPRKPAGDERDRRKTNRPADRQVGSSRLAEPIC